jgi:hypothetical protein
MEGPDNFFPSEQSKKIILKAEGRISDCPDSIAAGSDLDSTQVQLAHADRHGTEVVQRPTTAREDSIPVAVEAAPTSPTHPRSAGYEHPSAPTSGQRISPAALSKLSPTALLEITKTTQIEDDPYSISLGSGAQLRYGEADLYEPRSLAGLISNPDTLHSMWDDTSSAWVCDSLLVIRGVPVAIKHWRDFYSNFKHQNVWDSIKQNWHNFRVSRTGPLNFCYITKPQVLMQEYEELGKDGFRSKWSTNGHLIPSLRIVTTLRSSNRDRDEDLVIAAKQNLSEQHFNKIFSYKSKYGTRVLTSTSAIAKRYRKLCLSPGIALLRSNTSAEMLAPDAPGTPQRSS